MLCRYDRKAVGKTYDKADKQVIECAYGAHRRKRIVAKVCSYNSGVGKIISEIKKIAYEYRKCKIQYYLRGLSAC